MLTTEHIQCDMVVSNVSWFITWKTNQFAKNSLVWTHSSLFTFKGFSQYFISAGFINDVQLKLTVKTYLNVHVMCIIKNSDTRFIRVSYLQCQKFTSLKCNDWLWKLMYQSDKLKVVYFIWKLQPNTNLYSD